MKAKRWQAVVMVALAWVLWIEKTRGFGSDSDHSWKWIIVDDFDSKAGCVAKIRKTIKRISENNDPHFEVDGDQGFIRKYFRSETGKNGSFVFRCLPSDFDPRPRSAK